MSLNCHNKAKWVDLHLEFQEVFQSLNYLDEATINTFFFRIQIEFIQYRFKLTKSESRFGKTPDQLTESVSLAREVHS